MKQTQDKRKRQIRRRILSIVLVIAMLLIIVPFPDLGIDLSKKLGVVKNVHAEPTYSFDGTEFASTGTVTLSFTKAIELRRFSCWYNRYADSLSLNGVYYDITLANNDGGTYWDLYHSAAWNTYDTNSSVTDEYVYESIGTSENPFYGKITISTSNIPIIYSPVPLFNYVDQRTQIVDTDGDVRTLEFLVCELDGDTSSSVPVLANYVVNVSSSATAFTASVKLIYFDSGVTDYENTNAKDFAGIIGEIGTESQAASVTLDVQNDAIADSKIANVENTTGPVGLLCQKVNAGSTLNATINAGTNTDYTAGATTSYNAGGLVGEMYYGSKLIVCGTGLNGITQTITGKYAGGIVGYAENAYIDSEATDSDSKMTITTVFKAGNTLLAGTSGSGYLFGYYKNTSTSAKTIKLSSFTGLTVSSTNNGNAGGLIGVLENNPETAGTMFEIDGGAGVADGASMTGNLTITLPNGKTNCGGIIGQYKTNSLKNTLNITDVYAKITNGNQDSTSGIIGYVDDTTSAVYISMSKIYAQRTNNDTKGGGLIGTTKGTNAKGVFLDVSGYNKIKGKFSGGLVHTILNGVVRIEGITDLSELTDGNFIVTTRNSALVYSRGTGNQSGTASGEWKLIRNSHGANDISTWGEVLRLSDSALSGTNVVDETNTYTSSHADYHTVTLNAAPSGSISTLTGFALLALNIQLNTSSTSAILKTSGSNSATLLGSSISLTSNTTFDLAGTGITGLTRDTNDTKYQSDKFTGSITGGTGTIIKLAIGEPYGFGSDGSTLVTSGATGSGMIYGHAYNGLVARSSGASFSTFTVSGKNSGGTDHSQYIMASSGIFFGGVSAQSDGGDSFTSVTSEVELYAKRNSNNRVVAGGFIGRTYPSASGTVEFKSCSTTAVFHDDTRNTDDQPESYFGGYTGFVDGYGDTTQNSELTISFGTSGGTTPCAVGGSYNSVFSNASLNTIYGGLIGAVRGNNSHAIVNDEGNAYRTINAYAVTVDGLNIDSKTNTASGGLLGYAWHDTEVNLQNVTVGGTSASTVTISGGTGTKLAGLVYNATGHWTVGTVSIANVTYNAANASSSLGLLVNSTVNECRLNIDNTTTTGYAQDKKAGLLLEIANMANYTVDNTNALAIDSKVTVFDEIVAFSKNPDKNIADNGNSIISINTDGSGTGVTMTGSACNTYQNQSVYGKNTVTVNPNTRYYYNLDTIRTKASPSAAEQVLLWSVYTYAHGTAVKSFFETWKDASISGDLDMVGLSYYPVDAVKSVGTVSKLKFYNYEIETAEGLSGSGNTDGVTRSTTDTEHLSQHYIMHCGLFRNVSSDSSNQTVSVGNIVLEGNVGIIDSGSGFLVCGTLGGGMGVTTFGNGGSNTITLNGAYVNGASSSSFAPMLIANIASNTVLNVNGVKSQNYSLVQSTNGASWYAATSLIGAVGKTDGSSKNMKVNFSKITLDSRKQNITDADNTRLSTVYGSSKSIFKTATLLGHYYFDTSTDTDSEGVYNYTHDEDWGTETIGENQVTKHQVTYGQEVSASEEYDGKQEKYYGSSYYTDPTSGTNVSGEYSFSSSYFIPYVGSYNNSDSNYHELKVNHSVVSLTNGCGTYNDPYVVDGGMLGTVSSILNGNNPDSTIEICLPDSGLTDKTSAQVTAGVGDINLLWCTGSDYHHNYHWNGSSYSNSDGSKTYSKELVQAYLAGAYYVIDKDITVESGLSGSTKYTAFRGVIVGSKFTDDNDVERYPNVTLSSASPFIPTSNGCVVKNLNFITNANVTLTQAINNNVAPAGFEYNGGCMSYGVVIGKIMGGDNVIDNVGVTYSGTITSSTNGYIVPAGGYVGVVVNGGLFFRNMELVTAAKKAGLTDSNFSDAGHIGDSNTKFLYHNPIIGRVINGYAVTESTSYVPGAASQTMKNGTKNYAITDIDKTACNGGTNAAKVLDVTTSAITVPDAQAWFIMSCIVNSGTGSGSGTNQQMANDNISYSVTNYKTTHIGTYEDVGCGSYATKGYKDVSGTQTAICDNLIFLQSLYAEMGNKAAVTPYIIEKYTTQSATGESNFYKHYAKSICGSARSITMGSSGTTAEWTLPDGYRGIGGLNGMTGAANSGYNITVNGMTCNNTTINLNMKYQTYLYSTTSKIYQENYYPSDVGFGLFNTFKMNSNFTVSNLTLKGNVYIDTLNKDTGEPKHTYGKKNSWSAYADTWTDISKNTNGRVSAGMFAGLKNDKELTLSSISLNTISVHSSRAAGGLLGIAKKVTISECPATNVSVDGRWDTGGYIGGVEGDVTVIGNTSNKTEFNINTIVMRGVGYNERTNGRPGAVGGLIGRQYGGTVSISNMKLTKNGANGIVKNYQDQNDISFDETPVGGIIGATHLSLTVSNCEVNGITVYGDYADAGGVLGSVQHNSNATYSVTINNVSLDGTSSKDGLYITNRLGLGGFIGKINLNKAVNVSISDSVIKNYKFTKDEHNSSGDNYVGGIIGVQNGNSPSDTSLKNIYISDCEFNLPNDGKYGGVAGSINKSISGYNIAVNNITLATGTNASYYRGDIAGEAASTPTIKIVGFSRQNTPTEKLCNDTINTSSYIVFSDYSGTGFNGTAQTAQTIINGSANTTPAASVDINTPYANVNPAITIWSAEDHNTILTGDGIGSSYASLPISSIKSDLAITSPTTETQSRYNKRYSTVGTGITNNISSDNFTTFNTEWGAGTVTNDFAMLLIEDTNRANTTSLINNYIQAVTNQIKYADFGADSPTSGTSNLIYKVNLYKMSLMDSDDNGVYDYFEPSAANASSVHLHRNTTKKQFYMSSTDPDDVDSAEETPTFTLIDVAFYDPTVSSSQAVAYHLYIPVYVKKLMKFSFSIGTAANTPYDSSVYRNQMLMDNLGAAGSLHFTYTYQRTKQEWQEALDYGENFLTNYDKILTMTKQGTSTEHFDNDTLITLVDQNQSDKVYYARYSDVFNSGKLTMYNSSSNTTSSFKTGIGSGTGFVPINISDMLNITAATDANGGFVKIDTSVANENISLATVKIGDDYYRPKGSNENVDDTTEYSTYYKLTVINLAGNDTQLADEAALNVTESYYMSFFTRTSNNAELVNYYQITSPDKLTGGGAPAKAPVAPEAVNVLFGNLFIQTPVTYQANYNDDNPALITDTNNTVKVKLESTIQLTIYAKQQIPGLIEAQNIYQSFLVYMTRNDSGALTKAILGAPSAIASYTIEPVRNGSTKNTLSGGSVANDTGSSFADVGGNYVEVASGQNIASYLVDGGAKITAYVHITYDSQESRVAQFPGRTVGDEITKFAYVTASSNIGFDEDTTALSKTQVAAERTGTEMQYYIMSSTAPTLEYNAFADADGDIYGQLGINANDLDDNTGKVDVKTEAVYNVSPIAGDVADYDYVKVTFELKQKQQGSYDTYDENALQIRTYMKDVIIDSASVTDKNPKVYSGGSYVAAGNSATEYSFILPRSAVATNGDENLLTIPISFKVFTGSDVTEGESASFEGKGLMYSNYKITVSCEMLENATDENTGYSASHVSQYIIYTNAKLLKDYISSGD